MPSSSGTRWCPTPEQVMMLEELYRRGLKTPTASQIQRITAHLSLYGKIQGKNVFYWFQNHKARDRQKLRNKLLRHHQYNHHFHPLSTTLSTLNHLNPQGTDGVPHQVWRAEDLPLMRSCGHDSMMITEAGPTFPCCRSKPLQTLELFPLSSPSLSL